VCLGFKKRRKVKRVEDTRAHNPDDSKQCAWYYKHTSWTC